MSKSPARTQSPFMRKSIKSPQHQKFAFTIKDYEPFKDFHEESPEQTQIYKATTDSKEEQSIKKIEESSTYTSINRKEFTQQRKQMIAEHMNIQNDMMKTFNIPYQLLKDQNEIEKRDWKIIDYAWKDLEKQLTQVDKNRIQRNKV